MAYSEQQRAFYSKAKAAGWAPDKIKAGMERLGARATPPPAPETPKVTPQPPAIFGQGELDPTQGNTFLDNALIGTGQAMVNAGSGVRQLWNRATGDDEELKQLQADEAQRRILDAPLDRTGGGKVGNIVGNIAMAALPGGAAGKVAQYGLPAAMAAEAAVGGALGALEPTVEGESVLNNAAANAALGAIIPGAGAAVKSVIGKADPARTAAADLLRSAGVKVPATQEFPGLASKTLDSLLSRAPVTSTLMAGQQKEQKEQVAKALFSLLGEQVPATNEAMKDILTRAGSKIGQATEGQRIPLTGLRERLDDVAGKYSMLLDPQQKSNIAATMKSLGDLAILPGAKLKGESYQAIRSELGARAAGDSSAHGKALKGMRDALDATFDAGVSPAVAKDIAKARENYRLAKILNSQNIGDAFDVRKAGASVERAAKKAPVNEDARKLLEAENLLIPSVKPSTNPYMVAGAVLSPTTAASTLGPAYGMKKLLDTGIAQYGANSPLFSKLMAAALRGTGMSALQE